MPYRKLALRLQNGYQAITTDTSFRHFIEGPGELQFTPNVALRARARTPVLLDAGYEKLNVKIPGTFCVRLNGRHGSPDDSLATDADVDQRRLRRR